MARSFREASHLPKQSPDGRAARPEELPRQRAGRTPQMHGRYPDYDVLEQARHWDDVTRDLMERRAAEIPAIRFFTPDEVRCLRPLLDVLLAQDAEPRVPVLEMVDQKLHLGKLDGFRFADMPEDPETWRRTARHLDTEARGRGAASGFAELTLEAQQALVGDWAGGDLTWDDLDAARAWSVVMRATLSEFYSHPWAFNEIGFGGPAYPRGYMRLAAGASGREPYERPEAFELDPVEDTRGRGTA